MADDVLEEGAPETPAPRRSGRIRLILFIGGPILLLLIVAAGLYFSGVIDSLLGTKSAETADAGGLPKNAGFFDLPDMLVNLDTGGRRASFLKMTISLELDNKLDQPKIEAVLPRIIDTFQTYLRELRPEDLRGSAGLYRLREELLLRVNAAVAPAKVDDVLFREMLVQ